MNINKIVEEEKDKVLRFMVNRYAYIKLNREDLNNVPEDIANVDLKTIDDEIVKNSNNKELVDELKNKRDARKAIDDLEKKTEDMELAQRNDLKLYKLLDEAGKEVKKYV